jgi:hypothetical protein
MESRVKVRREKIRHSQDSSEPRGLKRRSITKTLDSKGQIKADQGYEGVG